MTDLTLERVFSWRCEHKNTPQEGQESTITAQGYCDVCGRFQGRKSYEIPPNRKGKPVGWAKYGRRV